MTISLASTLAVNTAADPDILIGALIARIGIPIALLVGGLMLLRRAKRQNAAYRASRDLNTLSGQQKTGATAQAFGIVCLVFFGLSILSILAAAGSVAAKGY